MIKRDACAWCGATDQPMVQLTHGKAANACEDWQACGARELKKSVTADSVAATFGRQRKNDASLFGSPLT
jgi:hypothetical protein